MSKRVILITGTPCVGKTTVAKLLVKKLEALYINLTDLAIGEKLILGKDKRRKTVIVDENRMKRKIRRIIKETRNNDVIIDGHYAASVVPKGLASCVFVLRRDPVELEKMMEKRGHSGQKIAENVASEILDVCLAEALKVHGTTRTCELDATGKSPERIFREILTILRDGSKKCRVGLVDWLGKLEAQGLTDKYLKT